MATVNAPFSSANLHRKMSPLGVLGGLLFTLALLALFSSVEFGWPVSFSSATRAAKERVAELPTRATQSSPIVASAAAPIAAPLEITVTGPAARGWRFGTWSRNG